MPLSQKQMEYLALAWQCFETEPKIDYNKFKDVAGLASANSARELMRVTKNKLKEEYGALNASSSPAKKAPAASAGTPRSTPGAKRGRPAGKKALAEMNGDEDDEDGVTPSKKAKKTNGVVKKERSEDEDDEDGEMLV